MMDHQAKLQIPDPKFFVGDRVIAIKEKIGTSEYMGNLGTITGAYYKGHHESWVYVVYIGNKQILSFYEFEISLYGNQNHLYPSKQNELEGLKRDAKEKKRKAKLPKSAPQKIQMFRFNDSIREEILSRVGNLQRLAFVTAIPVSKLQDIWSGEEEVSSEQISLFATKMKVNPNEFIKLVLEKEADSK